MDYIFYETATGRIIGNGSVPDADHYAYVSVPSGCSKLEVTEFPDEKTKYVSGGVVTSRPQFTTANSWNKTTISGDGSDAATFSSSLPNPTSVSYSKNGVGWSTATSVTTGSYSFTATASGTYYVKFSAFPYQDYTATITVNETLAEAQAAQWTQIKKDRAAAIAAGFTWNTDSYQSDPVSVVNIIGIALAAKIKQDNNEAFSTDWTTADNTVVTLDAQDAIDLGMACMSHVSAQYDTGVTLRTDIEAATTIAEVEAVVWPT